MASPDGRGLRLAARCAVVDTLPKGDVEQERSEEDESKAEIIVCADGGKPPAPSEGFERVGDLSIKEIAAMKAGVPVVEELPALPPPPLSKDRPAANGPCPADTWAASAETATATYAYILSVLPPAAVAVLAHAAADPPRTWSWVNGEQVFTPTSTPPCTPPASTPTSTHTPTDSLRHDLEAALQREEALLLKISTLETTKPPPPDNEPPKVLPFGAQHVPPTPSVPLTDLGPCATIDDNGNLVDMPLITKEGDRLLAHTPETPLTPGQFVDLQVEEYTAMRNMAMLLGILYPCMYPYAKSLPQRAGVQKGSAVNLGAVSFFAFALTIVLFARSAAKAAWITTLMGALLLFIVSFVLYKRGATKKARFLGKENVTQATNRAVRKMRRTKAKRHSGGLLPGHL